MPHGDELSPANFSNDILRWHLEEYRSNSQRTLHNETFVLCQSSMDTEILARRGCRV